MPLGDINSWWFTSSFHSHLAPGSRNLRSFEVWKNHEDLEEAIHGKTIGKPWENHGKTIGKPWENHGKMVVEWDYEWNLPLYKILD